MIHFLAQVAQTQSPFEWASQHIHVIGWGTVVMAAWKISTFFSAAKAQVTKTVGQIDVLSTNHMPHMGASLARQDLLLTNIDKNIERLADKI
jgi:hypothetical protein